MLPILIDQSIVPPKKFGSSESDLGFGFRHEKMLGHADTDCPRKYFEIPEIFFQSYRFRLRKFFTELTIYCGHFLFLSDLILNV